MWQYSELLVPQYPMTTKYIAQKILESSFSMFSLRELVSHFIETIKTGGELFSADPSDCVQPHLCRLTPLPGISMSDLYLKRDYTILPVYRVLQTCVYDVPANFMFLIATGREEMKCYFTCVYHDMYQVLSGISITSTNFCTICWTFCHSNVCKLLWNLKDHLCCTERSWLSTLYCMAERRMIRLAIHLLSTLN